MLSLEVQPSSVGGFWLQLFLCDGFLTCSQMSNRFFSFGLSELCVGSLVPMWKIKG